MNINLVLATGLVYSLIGALIMFVSHRAIYRKATRIVAGYPRILAVLQAQRHDGRLGLIILLCGNVLQVLAAYGYSAPAVHWRYPAAAVVAVILIYSFVRFLFVRRAVRRATQPAERRNIVRRVYESRRSIVLLEAAIKEAANRRAREAAKGPGDRSVVCLGHEWECRWWSDKFGVSSDVLKMAVRQVGPMVADIERYLLMKYRVRYAFAA